MSRRSVPLEDSPAWDIYTELLAYVDTTQAIPNENAFYNYVLLPKGYGLTLGEYRYYFDRLEREGFVKVNMDTRAISVLKRVIVPLDRVIPE